MSTSGQPPAPAPVTAQDLKDVVGDIKSYIDMKFIDMKNESRKDFNALKGSVDNLRGDYAEDKVRESLQERGIFSRILAGHKNPRPQTSLGFNM